MPKIEMKPVTSAAVKAIGYSLSTCTCRIEYIKGDVYDYDHVPYGAYQEFVNAPSIGKELRNFTATFKGVKVGVEVKESHLELVEKVNNNREEERSDEENIVNTIDNPDYPSGSDL